MMKDPNLIQSCTIEVDLEYPKELHNLHNDYLLGPRPLTLGNTEI